MASARYSGGVKGTVRHGTGEYRFSNPYFTFEGSYVDGKRNGHGRLLFGAGGCDGFLEGEWENGELVGVATRVWEGGRKYVGEMMGCEMHGKGEWTDGRTRFRGQFEHNSRNGGGEEETLNSRGEVVETFRGTWVNNRRHGPGHLSTSQGDQWKGVWVEGRLTDPDCTVEYAPRPREGGGSSLPALFKGGVSNGEFCGAGTFETADSAPIDALEGAEDVRTAFQEALSPDTAGASEAAPDETMPGDAVCSAALRYEGEFLEGRAVGECQRMLVRVASWERPEALVLAPPEEDDGKKKKAPAKGKPKGKGAEEEPSLADLWGPQFPAGVALSGGWSRVGEGSASLPAEAEAGPESPSTWLQGVIEEWGHVEEIEALINQADSALRESSMVAQMAADPRNAEPEAVLPARAGRALPSLSISCVWTPSGEMEETVERSKAAAEAALEAVRAAVAAAEADAGGKKKAKTKPKGKAGGKVEDDAGDREVWKPRNASERMGLAPWERLADGESGRVIEVTLRPREGASDAPSWLCVGQLRVASVRVSTEHGAALISGLCLHPQTPPGEYELLIQDASPTGLPRGKGRVAAVGFVECRVAVRVRPLVEPTTDS
jgi:hypothetical protein